MGELILFAVCLFMLGALNAQWIPDAIDEAGEWLKRRIMRIQRPDGFEVWVTPECAAWIDLALTEFERSHDLDKSTVWRMQSETNGTWQSLKHIAKKSDEGV